MDFDQYLYYALYLFAHFYFTFGFCLLMTTVAYAALRRDKRKQVVKAWRSAALVRKVFWPPLLVLWFVVGWPHLVYVALTRQ